MLSLLLVLACAKPTAAPAADPAADQAAMQRAQAATGELGKALKTELQGAVAEGGPVAGVTVCADRAQEITAAHNKAGLSMGRSSVRLRNPANQGPEWVRTWLGEHGAKPAAEVPARSWVEDAPEGRVARVIQPLPTGAMCMVCHGAPEMIPAEIQSILDERYPEDQATGFAPGDQRGVVWAEVTVNSKD